MKDEDYNTQSVNNKRAQQLFKEPLELVQKLSESDHGDQSPILSSTTVALCVKTGSAAWSRRGAATVSSGHTRVARCQSRSKLVSEIRQIDSESVLDPGFYVWWLAREIFGLALETVLHDSCQ